MFLGATYLPTLEEKALLNANMQIQKGIAIIDSNSFCRQLKKEVSAPADSRLTYTTEIWNAFPDQVYAFYSHSHNSNLT